MDHDHGVGLTKLGGDLVLDEHLAGGDLPVRQAHAPDTDPEMPLIGDDEGRRFNRPDRTANASHLPAIDAHDITAA